VTTDHAGHHDARSRVNAAEGIVLQADIANFVVQAGEREYAAEDETQDLQEQLLLLQADNVRLSASYIAEAKGTFNGEVPGSAVGISADASPQPAGCDEQKRVSDGDAPETAAAQTSAVADVLETAEHVEDDKSRACRQIPYRPGHPSEPLNGMVLHGTPFQDANSMSFGDDGALSEQHAECSQDDQADELSILRRRCEALQEENAALVSRLASSTRRCGALEEHAAASAAKLDAALSASKAALTCGRCEDVRGFPTTSAHGSPSAADQDAGSAGPPTRRCLDHELRLSCADAQLTALERRCRELDDEHHCMSSKPRIWKCPLGRQQSSSGPCFINKSLQVIPCPK
jgi:hypothetical protein